MPDALNNRRAPQATESCKCLSGGAQGKTLAKEAFDPQHKRLKNILATPAVEAVHACTLGTCQKSVAKQPRPPCLHLPHWGSEPVMQAKSVLHLCATGHFVHRVTLSRLFATLQTVACQASVRRWASGRNTGTYRPILLPQFSLEHYAIFLLPNCQLPEYSRLLVNPRTPRQLHQSHSPHRANLSHIQAASGANPSGRPTCREVKIK